MSTYLCIICQIKSKMKPHNILDSTGIYEQVDNLIKNQVLQILHLKHHVYKTS